MEVDHARGYLHAYRSAGHCMRSIIAKEGGHALYRGCLVNAFKVVPSTVIQVRLPAPPFLRVAGSAELPLVTNEMGLSISVTWT
jgi:Mitochondrial carrier protein